MSRYISLPVALKARDKGLSKYLLGCDMIRAIRDQEWHNRPFGTLKVLEGMLYDRQKILKLARSINWKNLEEVFENFVDTPTWRTLLRWLIEGKRVIIYIVPETVQDEQYNLLPSSYRGQLAYRLEREKKCHLFYKVVIKYVDESGFSIKKEKKFDEYENALEKGVLEALDCIK